MKVYIEPFEELTKTGISEMDAMAEKLRQTIAERLKYQIMWNLRSIENTISEENGIIVINKKLQIETRNFTQDTTDKIYFLLQSINHS